DDAVADVLRDRALVQADRFRDGRLEGTEHLAERLGIETLRHRRGPDDVEEHDRQMPPLRTAGVRVQIRSMGGTPAAALATVLRVGADVGAATRTTLVLRRTALPAKSPARIGFVPAPRASSRLCNAIDVLRRFHRVTCRTNPD